MKLEIAETKARTRGLGEKPRTEFRDSRARARVSLSKANDDLSDEILQRSLVEEACGESKTVSFVGRMCSGLRDLYARHFSVMLRPGIRELSTSRDTKRKKSSAKTFPGSIWLK